MSHLEKILVAWNVSQSGEETQIFELLGPESDGTLDSVTICVDGPSCANTYGTPHIAAPPHCQSERLSLPPHKVSNDPPSPKVFLNFIMATSLGKADFSIQGEQ